METELKFEIDARCAARLRERLGLPAVGRRLRSVYFDTPDLDLKAEGFVLRQREEGETRCQGIKQVDRHCLFTRHEWETPLTGEGLDFTAVDRTPLGRRLSRARRAALTPVVEVDVARACKILTYEGAEIEIALDEGEVRASGGSAPIREIEFELLSGPPAALFALARSLADEPLFLSFRPKSARGLALLDGGPDRFGARRMADPPLDGGQSASQAFIAIAAAAIAHIAAHAEILRERWDDESVHQLRVGSRRLRSAIRLFEPLLGDPQTEAVRGELRWLARSCDGARDMDVFMASGRVQGPADGLAEASFEALAATAQARRKRAHERAQSTVRGKRFRALMLDAAAWIEIGDWTRDAARAKAREARLEAFARQVLKRARRRVAKRAKALEAPEPEPRHRLRVAVKTLRHATAAFGPLFAGNRIKAFGEACAHAQDALGALTDIVSSRGLCLNLASAEETSTWNGAFAAGFSAGRIAAEEPAALHNAGKAVRRLLRTKPFW